MSVRLHIVPRIHLTLMVILILFATACKSKKVVQQEGPIPNRSSSELIKALEDHNYTFDWFAIETGIRLTNPDEGVSGKAYIRMKKDSIIWSSVKKASMEGVRTLITENSYAAINRTNHTYQRGSTEEALSNMGVSLDFKDLQEAIFGNIILLDSTTMDVDLEGSTYVVKGIDQDLQLKYWLDAYSLDLTRAQMIDYRGRTIDVKYEDYRELDSGHKIAFYRHYNVPYDDRGDAEIIMKAKKIEIDIPKKTRFSIPTHYDKI